MTCITLDLNNSLGYYQWDSSQILQKDATQQIEDLILFFSKQSKLYNREYDEFNPTRVHNTIFIHGERGAGKTTFLRNILNKYKEDTESYSVPLIDPTLISTHQHILVNVISSIIKPIYKNIKYTGNEYKFNILKKQLEDMAEGLKLLYSNDTSHNIDSSWFLTRALENVSNGQSLEFQFHKLIDIIIDISNAKFIIVAIDDVDTKTTKASEVLETIRCYLTHPKLITLITGDLKLYNHIIRNNKIKELNYSDRKLDNLIENLEQQYLTKIIPVEQRINLKNLVELEKKTDIRIKHNSLENDYKIKELLKKILTKSLNFNTLHLDSHIEFILNQPTRTVLQLIKSLIDNHE